MDATTQVETQNAAGDWTGKALGDLHWCGRPLILTDAQLAELASGVEVRFDSDWYAKVRLPRAKRGATIRAPRQPVCVRCGGPLSAPGALCGEC